MLRSITPKRPTASLAASVDHTEAAKVDQTDVRHAPGHWISA